MDVETAAPRAAAPKFTRALSGFGVIVLTLSVLSPGVSIFVSGGTIVQQAGSGAVVAFLIGACINYFQTSMSAELGSAYPTSGFDYAAIGHAMGDWAGAVNYLASLLDFPLFLNTSAVGIAIYLRPLFPELNDNVVTFATIAVCTALAMLNIRSSERITGLFLLIEVVALLLVGAVGLLHVQPHFHELIAQPMTMHERTWVGVGLGAMALAGTSASWSIAGSSQALYFSEDMKRPGTIGRIIMMSFVLTAILETVPVIGTIAGAQDLKAVLNSSAPFEEFLRQYLPDFGMKFVSISIAIAIFNATLAGFIAIGRNLFSMGRTQLFHPALNTALTRLTGKSDAPWIALLLIGLISALAQLLTMRVKIMLLAGNLTFVTIFYVWAVLAGRRSGRTRGAAYRTPFYPLVPTVGIFIVIGELVAQWIDRDVGRPSLFVWLGVYAVSYLYYRFVLMRRPRGWRMEGPEDIDAQTRGQPAIAAPAPSTS
jgi:amino acid transporter